MIAWAGAYGVGKRRVWNRDENVCHRETREVKGLKMQLGLLMTYLGKKVDLGWLTRGLT